MLDPKWFFLLLVHNTHQNKSYETFSSQLIRRDRLKLQKSNSKKKSFKVDSL